MCGRYTLFDDTQDDRLIDIINEVNRKHPTEPVKTGEIFPANPAPVLLSAAGGQTVEAERMIWGFPHFKGSGVIINARAETAVEKPMFRGSLEARRCAVPSTGFYEWTRDREKRKFRFNLPGREALYMAGIYQVFAGQPRFVILTTAANESMAPIHDRMPVILTEDEVGQWIAAAGQTPVFLSRIPQPLVSQETGGPAAS